MKRDDLKFLTSVVAGYLGTFIISKLFTPVSTDIDESRPRIMDVGHGKGPLYHLDVNGVIWDFEILSYNGPPDLQHKWIYTFSMAEGMLGPNACEILIEWPAGENPFFSVTNQGHTVHKFNLGINVGHHYSAAAIVDAKDNKTVLFELRDLTTGQVERWADPNHNLWHLRKVVGMSPEYHVVNYCVDNECNNIPMQVPFPDPYTIRTAEPLFITPSGIMSSIPCTTPQCVYNSNWQRECLTQKKGTLCRSSYLNRCWDEHGSEIICPKT